MELGVGAVVVVSLGLFFWLKRLESKRDIAVLPVPLALADGKSVLAEVEVLGLLGRSLGLLLVLCVGTDVGL